MKRVEWLREDARYHATVAGLWLAASACAGFLSGVCLVEEMAVGLAGCAAGTAAFLTAAIMRAARWQAISLEVRREEMRQCGLRVLAEGKSPGIRNGGEMLERGRPMDSQGRGVDERGSGVRESHSRERPRRTRSGDAPRLHRSPRTCDPGNTRGSNTLEESGISTSGER